MFKTRSRKMDDGRSFDPHLYMNPTKPPVATSWSAKRKSGLAFNVTADAVCRGGMAGAEAARAKKVPITLAPIPRPGGSR